MTAKATLERLRSKRTAALERAYRASDLTIPGLIPREGEEDTDKVETPFQSVGCRGVSNLTSKILLALFPPGSPFVRYRLDDQTKALLEAENIKPEDVEAGLAQLERKMSEEIDRYGRSTLALTIKHLVVAGNVLINYRDDGIHFYGLHQYCVERDGTGKALTAVLVESKSPKALPDDVIEVCKVDVNQQKDVKIYTQIEWTKKGRVTSFQEINDIKVPESEEDFPLNKSPWYAARWQDSGSEDYARSFVSEHEGDLASLEGLMQAVVEAAAISSKVLFLEHPNSATDVDQILKAENGGFATGTADDIDILKLDKYPDMRVALETAANLENRLAQAFLLRSGSTRDAERVTAEEIRAVAQELEDVLGGVYTVLAEELQRPTAVALQARMKARGDFPDLPEKSVSMTIVTGFAALGRNHAANRLRGFMQDAIGLLGEGALQYFNQHAIIKLMGTRHGVEELDSILLSAEEVEQKQQQDQLNSIAGQAAPGIMQDAVSAGLNQGQ